MARSRNKAAQAATTGRDDVIAAVSDFDRARKGAEAAFIRRLIAIDDGGFRVDAEVILSAAKAAKINFKRATAAAYAAAVAQARTLRGAGHAVPSLADAASVNEIRRRLRAAVAGAGLLKPQGRKPKAEAEAEAEASPAPAPAPATKTEAARAAKAARAALGGISAAHAALAPVALLTPLAKRLEALAEAVMAEAERLEALAK